MPRALVDAARVVEPRVPRRLSSPPCVPFAQLIMCSRFGREGAVPALVEADDLGLYVVKLRGAASTLSAGPGTSTAASATTHVPGASDAERRQMDPCVEVRLLRRPRRLEPHRLEQFQNVPLRQ